MLSFRRLVWSRARAKAVLSCGETIADCFERPLESCLDRARPVDDHELIGGARGELTPGRSSLDRPAQVPQQARALTLDLVTRETRGPCLFEFGDGRPDPVTSVDEPGGLDGRSSSRGPRGGPPHHGIQAGHRLVQAAVPSKRAGEPEQVAIRGRSTAIVITSLPS